MNAPFLLRVTSALVPRARRSGWLREWSAEFAHLDRLLARGGMGRRARALRLTVHTVDALEDAVGMWMRNPGTSKRSGEARLAARALARSPGFSAIAVLTLALGIGATTAIFSVVRGVVLRPLPYGEPGELVDVVLSFRNLETFADRPIPASEPEFLEIREGAEALASLAGYWTSEANFGGGAEPERVAFAGVSSNFLSTLGVEPALGRGFTPEEDRPGEAEVAILSDGLWRRAFGADPTVIGRDCLVNGTPTRIVGVLPADFLFPGVQVDLLVPNVIDPASPGGRSSHYVSMLGRLAPGVDLTLARARTDDLARRWGEDFPGRHGVSPGHPLTLVPLRESIVGDTPRMLYLLQGAVVLVLLIACANVASLMLVRAEHRQQETGIRLALGGSRLDVAIPFLAESVVLAVLGTGLGLALAYGSVSVLERMGPDVLARVGGVRIDGTVLGVALLTGVGAMLSFGLAPALMASAGKVGQHLREGDRRGTSGAGRLTVRRGIVVTQVALSVVLVVASGLLLKSFAQLRDVDPGFRPAGVITAQFSLSSGSYPGLGQVTAFHTELAERLASLPGVVAVGSVRALPFADGLGFETLSPTDRPADPDRSWNAQYQVVGPGYQEALGIPLLSGRRLDRSDAAGAPGAAVVSRSMAEQFWPGESALGRGFKFGPQRAEGPEFTVVGVVGDVRQSGYASDPRPTVYLPRAQATAVYGGLGTRTATVVVRTDAPPGVALEQLRGALRDLDADLPVARLSSMEAVLGRSVVDQRFLTLLVGAFSVLAVVLGAVGIGGVVAYAVARRTRELGLRMALGADRGELMRGVLLGALGMAGTGVVVGVVAAWLAGALLAEQLFQVSPRDPVVLTVGPLVLLAVSLLAAWQPARRATQVDPVTAMRSD